MSSDPILIIGAGFTGLSAALELVEAGIPVEMFEADAEVGGLAGSFDLDGTPLEKFYHHWFTNDEHVMGLIRELGLEERILLRPSRTGMYYANRFHRLSSPLDLLRFSALPLIDRIRLGLLTLRARGVKDWKALESKSAREWLLELGGAKVFEVVWEPLLQGKFGPYADEVSAVWFWNKLKLRGGSRGDKGEEQLAYFEGGFAALAEAMAKRIQDLGGTLHLSSPVEEILVEEGRAVAVRSQGKRYRGQRVLCTTHLPQFQKMLPSDTDPAYLQQLEAIPYLGNVCLVLVLKQSLSELYWMNVNDPGFPYVGIIEHTNLEPTGSYGGKHIVYLSKYLPREDALYQMDEAEALAFSIPHLQRMFPDFDPDWILEAKLWKAPYSQPVVQKNYSERIPAFDTPIPELKLCSMAQIYPEDRGTNYAIREGRKAGRLLAERKRV